MNVLLVSNLFPPYWLGLGTLSALLPGEYRSASRGLGGLRDWFPEATTLAGGPRT